MRLYTIPLLSLLLLTVLLPLTTVARRPPGRPTSKPKAPSDEDPSPTETSLSPTETSGSPTKPSVIPVEDFVGLLTGPAGDTTRVSMYSQIPLACKSSCPEPFFNNATSCGVKRTQFQQDECWCGKGNIFMDHWETCDGCMFNLPPKEGIKWTSNRPTCSGAGQVRVGNSVVLGVVAGIMVVSGLSLGLW